MSAKKLKLFIDASVFIAASASKEGGSAALFKIYQKVSFAPVTTQAVLNESELNIKANKSPLIEMRHYSIINNSRRIKNGKC